MARVVNVGDPSSGLVAQIVISTQPSTRVVPRRDMLAMNRRRLGNVFRRRGFARHPCSCGKGAVCPVLVESTTPRVLCGAKGCCQVVPLGLAHNPCVYTKNLVINGKPHAVGMAVCSRAECQRAVLADMIDAFRRNGIP